jgi:hypothetical protein
MSEKPSEGEDIGNGRATSGGGGKSAPSYYRKGARSCLLLGLTSWLACGPGLRGGLRVYERQH